MKHAGVCCSGRPKTAEVIAEEIEISVALPSPEYEDCFLILPVASSSQSLDTFKQDHI